MGEVEKRSRAPSRRQFVTLGVGAFTVALAPRLLRPDRRLVRRTVPVMGTVADMAVVHRDARHAQGAIEAAIEALVRVERAMTRFSPESEIGRANRFAARDAVGVSAETARVIAAAVHWADATDGAFDPAIGRLVELWDVANRTEPPARDAVLRFAGRRLHRHIEVGRRDGGDAVRFHDGDVSLDLDGIAKGYGVDAAVTALRDWGIRDAIVNAGGDLYALGVSLEGDPWRVGVRSPDSPGSLRGTLEVSDRAVATSGDYEQGFDHGGRRYHHLLDPRTAEPRLVAAHSLTITADDCMTADAAATALFGRSDRDASRVLAQRAPGATLVHTG